MSCFALRVQPRIELPHDTDRACGIALRPSLDPMGHAADAHHGSQLRGHAHHDQQPGHQGKYRQRVPDRVVVLPPGVDDQPSHADECGGGGQGDRQIGHRRINGSAGLVVRTRNAVPISANTEGAAR